MSDVDHDDFAPTDPGEVALAMLVHGSGRRDAAGELGMTLVDFHRVVAQAVRERSGETGTPREHLAILHASLDDIVRLAYAELGEETEETAPLLEVLLGVARLRAGLLASNARSKVD